MAKQIEYYMDYPGFVNLSRLALGSGCQIIRRDDSGHLVPQNTIDAVTPDCCEYYFYLPEAGPFLPRQGDRGDYLSPYDDTVNAVLEAGWSRRMDEKKRLTLARLAVVTGHHDSDGGWVPRPDCLTKMYDRLARRVKRLAPLTRLRREGDSVYIVPQLRHLLEEEGYNQRNR